MHYIGRTFDVEETGLKILYSSFSGTYNKQCKSRGDRKSAFVRLTIPLNIKDFTIS